MCCLRDVDQDRRYPNAHFKLRDIISSNWWGCRTLRRSVFFLPDIRCWSRFANDTCVFQQQPPPPDATFCPSSFKPPPWPPLLAAGAWAIRAFISAAIVTNACSTLAALFADVSRKGIPNWSANSFATAASTTYNIQVNEYQYKGSNGCWTFLEVRSHLFPTSILLTCHEYHHQQIPPKQKSAYI